MKRLIAARLGSYGEYADEGWSHLPTLGVYHVEIVVPEPGQLSEMKERLADHGLQASSLHAPCDLRQADVAATMGPSLDAGVELGAKICYVSAASEGITDETAYERLQEVGEHAAAHGVIVTLETHRGLAHNGDVASAGRTPAFDRRLRTSLRADG